MPSILRLLQLLTIVLWVGGLIFFAFILAPTAFAVLPTLHSAGLVVGASLKHFQILELISGAIFLAVTAELFRRAPMRIRGRYELEFLLAAVMLLATAYLQWNVIPRMDATELRAGGDITQVAASNPARLQFEHLHKLSERTAGTVLLLGLAVVFLLSREHAPLPTEA